MRKKFYTPAKSKQGAKKKRMYGSKSQRMYKHVHVSKSQTPLDWMAIKEGI